MKILTSTCIRWYEMLMLCILGTTSVFAQEIDPPAIQSLATSASVHSTSAVPLLGWNWGSNPSKDFNNALSLNALHMGTLSANALTSVKRSNNDLLIPEISSINSGHYGMENPFVAMGVHFDPVALIDGTTATLPNPVYPNSGTFGFLVRHTQGTVTANSVQAGYGAYKLHTTANFPATGGTLVLEKPWPDNVLVPPPHSLPDSANGRQVYVSLNLRLLSAGGDPNDEILRITIPYTTATVWNSKRYIRFSQIPKTTAPVAFDLLPDSRGFVLSTSSLVAAASGTTSFTVKRYMLSGLGSSSVTLSAFFLLDNDEFNSNSNPFLRDGDNFADGSTIKRLGLEITYLGKADIAINWAGFQTPKARSLFEGKHDATIISSVSSDLNLISTYNSTNASAKAYIHRFYIIDECGPALWRSLRYAGKLLNGLTACETGSAFRTDELDYAYMGRNFFRETSLPELWPGGYHTRNAVPSPYIWYKQSEDANASISYSDGYNRWLSTTAPNPSEYETYFRKDAWASYEVIEMNSVVTPTDDNIAYYRKPENQREYERVLFSGDYHSSLMSIERFLYFGYYKDYGFLYDTEHKWWSNIWQWSNWGLTGTGISNPGRATVQYWRPKTGEELRASIWMPLVLGAKGLLYYKAATKPVSVDYGGSQPWDSYKLGEVSMINYAAENITADDYKDILGNIDYTAFLQSDDLGIDYLQSTQNSYSIVDDSRLDLFINSVSAVAANYGVPSDRLYLGRKTHRLEVAKINQKLRSIDASEFLSLHLKAWYGKGFTEWQSSVSTASWTAFESIVSVTSSTVRQIGRIKDGKPDYEAADSSFFDITYFEREGVSPTTTMYLGVLNRRTDPVVIVSTATIGGIDFSTTSTLSGGKEYRFYPTEEFERLVTTGTFDAYGGAYAQLGAREIGVKFNYKTTDADYQLLRVQELGGGIDTVVGEDSRLPMLFKPGEGKLFRVTPLPVTSKPTGDLAYSNQRKIVAYPKKNSSNELYYHMVYQSTKLGVTSVYYRRSKVVTTGTLSENIEWQNERKLAVTTATGVNHAYPSLVVRNNSAGNPTVYVVYACTGNTIAAGNVLIAESVFDAEADYSTTGAGVGLHLTKGDALSEWGTPVISAGANGNYYAWADKDAGIGVGYKSTSATTLSAVGFVSWVTTGTKTCQHPALNTYSRIAWDENEAALVWQEDGHIYYARVYDGTTGSIKLRPIISSEIVRNTAQTIAQLSDPACATDNKLPVVYRSIETTYRSPYAYGYFDVLLDRVFWQGRGPRGQSIICSRKIDCSDVVSPYWGRQTRQMFFRPISSIFSSLSPLTYSGRLEQPDVAQGKLLWDGLYNRSDSALMLNCISYLDATGDYSVWHVPLNYWTTLINGSNSLPNLRNSSWMPDRGRRVHLTAKPSYDNIGSWHLNRRIIESVGSQAIVTSAKRFYRATREAESITPLPGFAKSCAKYYVLEPYIDQTEVFWEVEKPVVKVVDTTLWVRFDTLFTNWFAVGSSADISFYGMGSDTSFVQLELVKQSDGSRQTIALAPATDSTAKLITRTVINGADNLYRLELRKKHADAGFVEDILLGQLAVDAGGGGGIGPARRGAEIGENSSVVNLATGNNEKEGPHATVYPNPAGEKVFISVYRSYDSKALHTPVVQSEKLLVTVLNTLGEVLYRANVLPGSVLEMATDTLPSGVYLVRVEDSSITGTLYGTTPFVVQR